MKNNFIITTTNNIEGCPIQKYIDTICTNIVIGTNIFSDFAASFTDFFGGRSDSYKRKLEIIYNEASKELKQKALNLGANAIVGFKVDFDEISSKDKSMFMVSTSGTACIIDYVDNCSKTIVDSNIIISQTDLEQEMQKRFIISKINGGASIREEWINFLIENPQIEVIDNLLDRYISYYKEYNSYKETVEFVERYLSLFPKENIIEKVYSKYEEHKQEIKSLISKCQLFNSNKILSICKIDIHSAINIILTTAEYYQKSDVEIMEEIYNELTSLPDTGKIEATKSGLLGKEQEKFICQNGHKNPLDSEYCENYNCGVNIKGLTKEEVKNIKIFKQRIDILHTLINRKEQI